MPAAYHDFVVLGATVGAGMVIGLLHDCWLILGLGHGAKPSKSIETITDPIRLIAFWLLATAVAWAVLVVVAAGAVRGFVLLGFAAGAVVYYLTLSVLVRRAIVWLRQGLVTLVRLLLDAVAWAVLLPWRALVWLGRPVIATLTMLLALPGRLLLSAFEAAGRLVVTALRWLRGIARRRRPPPNSGGAGGTSDAGDAKGANDADRKSDAEGASDNGRKSDARGASGIKRASDPGADPDPGDANPGPAASSDPNSGPNPGSGLNSAP